MSLCSAEYQKRAPSGRSLLALFCALLFLLQCLLFPCGQLRGHSLYTELFHTLREQYGFTFFGIGKDLAQVRFERAMDAIYRNMDAIEDAGEQFGIPPEVIAAVLLKEQFTRSAPDFLVVAFAPLRGGRGSTGLGAVTAKTAKKAYGYYGLSRRLPGSDQDILRLFMEDETEAVFATACVLGYEAEQFGYGASEYTSRDGTSMYEVSSGFGSALENSVPDNYVMVKIGKNGEEENVEFYGLTEQQWHRVYNKYNGDIEYANKTVEYLPELAELF